MKNKMIPLLIGNLPPPISGQAVAFEALVNRFKILERKHEIVNYAEKPGHRGSLNRIKDIIFSIPSLINGLRKTTSVYIIISSSLRGFIRDIIYILAAKCFRKKIVLHSHSGYFAEFLSKQSSIASNLIKWNINLADKTILLSDTFKSDFSFLPDEKIAIVHNGVKLPENKPTPKKLDSNGSIIEILFLSNLITSKGYLDLIDAVHDLVKNRGIEIKCHFAGAFMLDDLLDDKSETRESLEKAFREKVEMLDLTDNIIYHGSVYGDDKMELFKKAHFFILPTYYHIEAQPISIIESLVTGCVTISTKYRGIPELIENGKSGYMVEPQKPIQISEVIMNLIANPIEYTKVSKGAIEAGFNNFSDIKYADKIIKILENS